MRKLTRKTLALSTAAVLLGGGAAFAYWTNSGTGTGTVATGTNVGITVNQTSVMTAMYPGQAAQPLSGTFTNTNASPVFVAAVTANPTVTIDAGHSAACLPASYTMGGTATVGVEVPVGTGGSWSGLTIQMNNLASNQDACKGATVTVTYASS